MSHYAALHRLLRLESLAPQRLDAEQDAGRADERRARLVRHLCAIGNRLGRKDRLDAGDMSLAELVATGSMPMLTDDEVEARWPTGTVSRRLFDRFRAATAAATPKTDDLPGGG